MATEEHNIYLRGEVVDTITASIGRPQDAIKAWADEHVGRGSYRIANRGFNGYEINTKDGEHFGVQKVPRLSKARLRS